MTADKMQDQINEIWAFADGTWTNNIKYAEIFDQSGVKFIRANLPGTVDVEKLSREIADVREINFFDVKPVLEELIKRDLLRTEKDRV